MIRPSCELGGSVTDLERLVAIDAIRDLMARYARFADNKQWEDLADTFLPDGTFPQPAANSVVRRAGGAEGLLATERS